MKLDVKTAAKLGIIGRVEVYVDGKIVKHAIAADDTAGWVDTHKIDESGHAVFVGCEIQVVRRYGSVRIHYRQKDKSKPAWFPSRFQNLLRSLPLGFVR